MSNGNGSYSASGLNQHADRPEKIKLWVLMFGLCALIVLLYASYLMFFKSARQSGYDDKRPTQPARELRHKSAPAHVGDFAARSNGAPSDTNQSIEVRATINSTLPRPQ